MLPKKKLLYSTITQKEVLYRDSISGIWFKMRPKQMHKSLYEANDILMRTGSYSLAELYDLWGLYPFAGIINFGLPLCEDDSSYILGWGFEKWDEQIGIDFVPELKDGKIPYINIVYIGGPDYISVDEVIERLQLLKHRV